MRRAAIDLSWASTSLLVADEGRDLVSVFEDSLPFPGVKYTDNEGILSSRGIEKIESNMNALGDIARAMGSEEIAFISTSLLRHISNRDEVKAELEQHGKIGIIELTGKEEAYALFLANERYSILKDAVLINIGGSSTKICPFDGATSSDMLYLPFGAACLASEYASSPIPTEGEMKKMKDHVKKILQTTEEKKYENAVLSGGNIKAIWKIYEDWYEIESTGSECLMQRGKLKKLIDILLEEKKGKRLIAENTPDRMVSVIPTALALKQILSWYGINNMTVSPFGVKEGWMRADSERRHSIAR